MITPSIEANKIREAIKELKELDANVLKDLRADLRTQIGPLAERVAASVPIKPPLSGMGQYGPTGWSPVRPSVSFTPGRSRKMGNHLVSIRINPTDRQRGLYLGELAGSRTAGLTKAGRNLIKVLNTRFPMQGKGGRFAYKKFRELQPTVVAIATRIVNDRITKVNIALDV